jgi:hypothetical protein
LSLKTKVDGVAVVWHQNHWDGFLRFGPKTSGNGFLRLASKLVVTVSPVWPQNRWWVSWLSFKTKVVEGFLIWASKPTATV